MYFLCIIIFICRVRNEEIKINSIGRNSNKFQKIFYFLYNVIKCNKIEKIESGNFYIFWIFVVDNGNFESK